MSPKRLLRVASGNRGPNWTDRPGPWHPGTTRWTFLESRRQMIVLVVFAVLLSTGVVVYRNSQSRLQADSEGRSHEAFTQEPAKGT